MNQKDINNDDSERFGEKSFEIAFEILSKSNDKFGSLQKAEDTVYDICHRRYNKNTEKIDKCMKGMEKARRKHQ